MSQSKFKPAPLVFGLGVIVAIASAAKLPTDGTNWPDTLPVFGLAAALCALAIYFWRREISAARKDDLESQTGSENSPEALMSGLMPPLDEFVSQIGEMDADAICARVDSLLETYVLPFATGRQKVLDALGMEKGAEVLVVVAYGERMLNRTWSAAGDGHLPEACASLPESVDAFKEAYALLCGSTEPAAD